MATQTKKPTTRKTPATNAAKGVVDETEIRTFKSGGLPPVPAGPDDPTRIGAIADVAFFSGLFPGETPATLAIRILAGRSLGLDDAQALFDVETEAPGQVRYRPAGRTFEQANDDVEAAKYAAECKAAGDARDGGLVNDDRLTPEPASPPAEGPGNVVKGPFPGGSDAETAESYQKNANSANKRPTPTPDAKTPDSKAEPGNVEARAESGEARAVSANVDTPSAATPDPTSAAEAAAAIGNVSPETVAAWRQSIANMSRDLGLNPDEKTATFDAKPLTERKKYFDEVYRYYTGRIDKLRKSVLDRLRADGKTSADAQKGFYLYADVPFELDAWTYADATKADAAVAEFLRSKAPRNDPPRAA